MNQINQKRLRYLKIFLLIILGVILGLLLSGNYTIVKRTQTVANPAPVITTKVVQTAPHENPVEAKEISREISRENPRDEETIEAEVEENEEDNEWQYEPTEPESVIDSRGKDYVVIRVYEPDWGGYCRIRYYCYDSCNSYNWYWSFGTRYYDQGYRKYYWRPNRDFRNHHRHTYRDGYYNTYRYRQNSARSIGQDHQYRTNGHVYKNGTQQKNQNPNFYKETMKNQKNYRPVYKSYKPVYKYENGTSKSSSFRKSAPRTAPRTNHKGGIRAKKR